MKQLNIAIAGLGIVGGGVYEILTKQIDLLNQRSKAKINLVAVSSRTKKNFIDESKVKFYQTPLDLADDKTIDVVVETIGGADGIALELCKKSLKNKKHYITANKAMIATHGSELAKLAEENQVALAFEASVAGAIPVIKTLKEGLAANQISKIYGILNGTCNYILSKMEEDEISFEDALKQAQKLGYAEADPTFDIEGIDTAHKIAILAAIAKNSAVTLDKMHIEGITKISLFDIKSAKEFGYKIKLFGVFEDLQNGNIKQAVYPCLVSCKNNIANVNDSFNAILSLGNNCDWNLQIGRGAGSNTTASAVVADIIDIANGRFSMPFGISSNNLNQTKIADIKAIEHGYYLRFIAEKNFAKEGDFIKDIFNDNSPKQVIIEEIDGEKIIYGLKLNKINSEQISTYIKNLSSHKQISQLNFIRIENLI
ncbi:MAG: hom [Rickettsiaceae bacterium]|jgi:homoserine dehydrogenase|nr:hom [Rickettsiaceae bacterium]